MKEKRITLDLWEENNVSKGYKIYQNGYYWAYRVEESLENPKIFRIFSGAYSEKMMHLSGTHENLEKEFESDGFFAFIKAASLAHDYIRDLTSIDKSIHFEDLTLRVIRKDNLSAQSSKI